MHGDTSTTEANMAEMDDKDDATEEAQLGKTVFYVLLDNVITRLNVCFNAVKKLAGNYVISWKYPTMCEE